MAPVRLEELFFQRRGDHRLFLVALGGLASRAWTCCDADMNEGSKLMNTIHPTFDTMASTGEEELQQSVPMMDRRVSMPARRRQSFNWMKAIKGYAKSYIPPIVTWYV